MTHLDALADAGIITSIAYGPMGDGAYGVAWSVMCRHPDGHEFDRPFLAESFDHACEIAWTECQLRHWVSGEVQ